MKLELKHLASYRHTKLRFIMTCDWTAEFSFEDWDGKEEDYKEGSIWQWAGTVDSDLLMPLGEGDLSWVFRKDNVYISTEIDNGGIKPILRPLSDFTKEIGHNGNKYCVMSLWFSVDASDENDYELFNKIPDYWQTVIKNIDLNGFGHVDYGFLKILFEHHFDVFGLIEKGLAIDINQTELNK